MDSTTLGNANKTVKQLSKNPMVPWKRLVDLNLDLMSKSRVQNTYQATNHPDSFACNLNPKGVSQNDSDDSTAATSTFKPIHKLYDTDSLTIKTTVVREEAVLCDDLEDIKRYRKFKVADDVEYTSPATAEQSHNSGVNCSEPLCNDVGVSVTGANDECCWELPGVVHCIAQPQWSSHEPDTTHSSSSLEVITNDDDADLTIQTEINGDNASNTSLRKTKSLNSICHFNNYRDSNNDDSGIATREYTICSSKSALMNAETDLDYESDWDDNEVNFAADDIELCESSDDNESEKFQVSKTSRPMVAEIRMEDSRHSFSESERVHSPSCYYLDDKSICSKEKYIPQFNKNIISENTLPHLLDYLETDNVDDLTVDRYESNRLKELLQSKCSSSRYLHSMRQEQSQVDNESCRHSIKSSHLKSVSANCLVPSGKCNVKLAPVNKTDEFDSLDFKVSHSENKNEGRDALGEIDFSLKNVEVNGLYLNIITDNDNGENMLKRSINNGRVESADLGCANKGSRETQYSHELDSYKQPKKLTRNPLTSWKHLVDVNIESLAIKNAESVSNSDIDQPSLSVSIKSESNTKNGEPIDANRQYYGFKNIDSSILHDYIDSGIFTECSSQQETVIVTEQSEVLNCDCVIIDDLRFDEPRDGLKNNANNRTDVVCVENIRHDCVFVNLNGATDYQENNETVSSPTSVGEMAKCKETPVKAGCEARIYGYQEVGVETMRHDGAVNHMLEIQFQTSGEVYAPTPAMQNKDTKSGDDQAAMERESKSEHEHCNILLEATFDNPLHKIQLLPDKFKTAKDESVGLQLDSKATESVGKYERIHSTLRQKRTSRSKPLTKRHRDRCPKSTRAKSLVTHDKYHRQEMREELCHPMGLVEFSRTKIETKTPENSDIIGAGWSKVSDFISRLVNVFTPSVQRYDCGEERDNPALSNVIDGRHEVYSENVSSHTNNSKLPRETFHNYSHNLFEGDFVYSTNKARRDSALIEPPCHKRTRKQRRRKEWNRPPSAESTIESTGDSFHWVNTCKQSSQYNPHARSRLLQITDTNTCLSDYIPTNNTVKMTSVIHDSNARRCDHGDNSALNTSSALTRSQMYANDAGSVKFQVHGDIPIAGVSVGHTGQGNINFVSSNGSRVSFNVESRKAKTAIVLDTKYATTEKELSEFFTSNSANTGNHPMFTPGRKFHRNDIREKAQEQHSPLTQDRVLTFSTSTHSSMASSKKLSLLTQTLPDALRSAPDLGTAIANSEEESSTKQSQVRRVEMTEDNVDESVGEIMTDDLLTSSLECLLEMLLQRGKVSQAFVATVKGQVLAKTSGLLVTAQDVTALVCCLTSSYQGVARITLLTSAYQCFKLEQGSSLVGRADNSVFVARQGKQTIVVGFAHTSSPGSCIREIQELSLALGHRGL